MPYFVTGDSNSSSGLSFPGSLLLEQELPQNFTCDVLSGIKNGAGATEDGDRGCRLWANDGDCDGDRSLAVLSWTVGVRKRQWPGRQED
ncbi:hypothetical protein M0R45_010748 [Rubus argutus]|uniref:Uncharacterized protein n=1 Tax=Rubus argutus TaxID=59490 RepID=A0AAW1YB94_RUBAR